MIYDMIDIHSGIPLSFLKNSKALPTHHVHRRFCTLRSPPAAASWFLPIAWWWWWWWWWCWWGWWWWWGWWCWWEWWWWWWWCRQWWGWLNLNREIQFTFVKVSIFRFCKLLAVLRGYYSKRISAAQTFPQPKNPPCQQEKLKRSSLAKHSIVFSNGDSRWWKSTNWMNTYKYNTRLIKFWFVVISDLLIPTHERLLLSN